MGDSALETACQFLTEVLGSGPQAAKTIYEQADKRDVNRFTLQRASGVLRIVKRQVAAEDGSRRWMWTLPDLQAEPQESGEPDY